MDLEKTRKDVQKIERDLHSEIFRLSGIESNYELAGQSMIQLSKMQTAVYTVLNLIEAMRCNEVENE